MNDIRSITTGMPRDLDVPTQSPPDAIRGAVISMASDAARLSIEARAELERLDETLTLIQDHVDNMIADYGARVRAIHQMYAGITRIVRRRVTAGASARSSMCRPIAGSGGNIMKATIGVADRKEADLIGRGLD